ncbi:MAG: alanine racemase [Armatimonadota bacterium]
MPIIDNSGMSVEEEKLWLRTWLEISVGALKDNYTTFRALIGPDCRLMAIAKSNAYGHGLIDYSRTMQALGVDWIGVDSIVEAVKLRGNGVTVPILVLGYTLPQWFAMAMEQNISLTISTCDSLRQIAQRRLSGLRLHLKIDTGMHRQGFQLDELPGVCRFIADQQLAGQVEGMYTHFAAAKNPAFPADTHKQVAQFTDAVSIIQSAGMRPLRHASATGGTLVFPETHFDMVRIGIGLMGYWPSNETKACYGDRVRLRPALTWKTVVTEVKPVRKGEAIGYDFTETLPRDSTVAILPLGYWHGYRRSLSSIGHVLVHGRRARVLGRISMDMISIDVTDLDGVQCGDEVTLIGRDGAEAVEIYELASLSNTSWYETITQINPLIKKFYLPAE